MTIEHTPRHVRRRRPATGTSADLMASLGMIANIPASDPPPIAWRAWLVLGLVAIVALALLAAVLLVTGAAW